MAADTVVITMMALANPCTGPAILIYFYFYRYASTPLQDSLIVGPVGQFNFHRYPLGHFYKVSCGIIRRKKGKLSAVAKLKADTFPRTNESGYPSNFTSTS